jgi:NAD(P)H-nitrite reductase large subunit
MHYVIIGAGPAGIIAAETLRKTDPRGEITLIGDEPEPPYSRMAIPYLLTAKIAEQGTYLRHDSGHYAQRGIPIVQDRVTAVDPAERRLTLEQGGTLGYDRLLIATGSRPVLPPIDGIQLPSVHTCWTLADARQIIRLARPGAKVVLIGAGFIGCIILQALAERGVELTVVEQGDRMVPRMMNQVAGGLLKTWCESKGVKVYTATQVMAIGAAPAGLAQRLPATAAPHSPAVPNQRLSVLLDNGHELEAALVIVAAGVTPNTQCLQDSGVEINRGILVNHWMQTNIPEIYAAGDVACGRDFSTGGYDVHAIQPTASEHGRFAALNMAGIKTVYRGSLSMNVLDTLGLISSSFGLWRGVAGGESVEISEPERFRYLSLQFREDIMVGANSVGLTQHVGVLRGLIQGGIRLGQWKNRLLQDPSRLMEAYLARTYSAQHGV